MNQPDIPFELLDLLLDLHHSRANTREIARTKLESEAINGFIDIFTGIEIIVLAQIDHDLRDWATQANLEIKKLKEQVSKLEKKHINHHNP